jgi:hypothetical protein
MKPPSFSFALLHGSKSTGLPMFIRGLILYPGFRGFFL